MKNIHNVNAKNICDAKITGGKTSQKIHPAYATEILILLLLQKYENAISDFHEIWLSNIAVSTIYFINMFPSFINTVGPYTLQF